MEKVVVSKGILVGLGAGFFLSLLALGFFIGRESARKDTNPGPSSEERLSPPHPHNQRSYNFRSRNHQSLRFLSLRIVSAHRPWWIPPSLHRPRLNQDPHQDLWRLQSNRCGQKSRLILRPLIRSNLVRWVAMLMTWPTRS